MALASHRSQSVFVNPQQISDFTCPTIPLNAEACNHILFQLLLAGLLADSKGRICSGQFARIFSVDGQ
jgi:hypothetical protein